MNVVARAVAFVEVLVAAQVEQVELVDQAVAFQQVDGAVDRDAMRRADRVFARARGWRPRPGGARRCP